MLRRALVTLTSFLIAFFIAELGIRILQPVGSERKPVYVSDRELGWALAPNQGGALSYQRNYSAPSLFNNAFRTNSLGLRDREHPASSSGKQRIMVLGDSFTEGWGVDEIEAYPRVLERLLGNVDVWNMGVVGYSTDQEFLQLKRWIDRIHPGYVILGFYENDIGDNTRSETPWFPHMAKPRFVVRGDSIVLDNASVESEWERETARSKSLPGRAKTVLQGLATARFVDFTLKKIRANRSAGTQGRNELLDTWVELNSYRIAETKRMIDAWRVTEDLLDRIQDLCAAHGAKLLIVYIPRLMEVAPGLLEREQRNAGLSEPANAFDLTLPETKLAAAAERHAIPLVRMHGLVADRLKSESLYLAPIDGHLNANGQAFVARTIAARLRERGWSHASE